MAKRAIYEELDNAIEQMMDGREPRVNGELAEMVQLAGNLLEMPSADFRARLRSDLEDQAMFIAAGRQYRRERATNKVLQMPRPMPALFSSGPATYPVKRTNFVWSVTLHAAALLLVVGSAWMVKQTVLVKTVGPDSTEISTYIPPVAAKPMGGGGGGGDRDKLETPKGNLPRTADRQFTSPAMVLRNNHPALPMEPTVVAPQVQMATNMPNLGNPMSPVPFGPPSDGTGSGGGMGSGSGGGIGVGRGPGVGAGIGGGIGGGVFRVGGGVSAPRVLYSPDPDYTEEARKARYQGTVMLWLVVGTDGRAHDVKVARSLGLGLDEKAVEAVKRWNFEPALKDGRPVAVQINVEVNFRMY